MKISTRLRIGAAVPAAIVIVLVSLVVLFSNEAARQTERQNLAMRANTAVSELDIVMYEYLIRYEERMEQQWHSRYDSAMAVLDEAADRHTEPLGSTYAGFAGLGDLFSRVTANHQERQELIQEGASQKEIDAATLVEERLVAQLLVKSQSVVADTSGFAELAYADALKAQDTLRNLILPWMIALALAVVATSLLVARSISVPLGKLAEYSRRVGEGEYTAEIEIKGTDEIANVTSTVETMVGRLLTTQEELRTEIAERKKTEQQISASLREKETLLGELYHRVNNNLQVISSMLGMSSLRLRDQQAIDLCTDARTRVHTMALVHSQLYGSQRLDQVSMARHVRQLVDYLSDVYAKGKRISSVVEASGLYLSMAQAIPCALVLNELVSNALKHAFKEGQEGRIEISMQRSAGGVVSLKVKDDGSGIPDDIDIYRANTMGLKLARNLVEKQLRGKIHLERNEGTEFVIKFNALQEETGDAQDNAGRR